MIWSMSQDLWCVTRHVMCHKTCHVSQQYWHAKYVPCMQPGQLVHRQGSQPLLHYGEYAATAVQQLEKQRALFSTKGTTVHHKTIIGNLMSPVQTVCCASPLSPQMMSDTQHTDLFKYTHRNSTYSVPARQLITPTLLWVPCHWLRMWAISDKPSLNTCTSAQTVVKCSHKHWKVSSARDCEVFSAHLLHTYVHHLFDWLSPYINWRREKGSQFSNTEWTARISSFNCHF